MDADETRDLIAETVEKAEEGSAHERTFRNRVAALVGILAVLLAVVHMASAGAARETLTGNIRASDTFAYMQAKILRETILKTAADAPGVTPERHAVLAAEAAKLRAEGKSGHSIGQLQRDGEALQAGAREAADKVEGYEIGETALQVAIVLLSIALIGRSRALVLGAVLLAAIGVGAALLAYAGI